MEEEFTEWFKANEKRFAHGQFDEKQIAYSAWLEGQNQALRIHDVVGRSEQLLAVAEYVYNHFDDSSSKTAKDYLQNFLSQ